MGGFNLLPNGLSKQIKDFALKLYNGKRIKITDRENIDNKQIINGKSVDFFNIVNYPAVIINKDKGVLDSISCNCKNKNVAGFCVHSAALAMLVSDSISDEIHVAAPKKESLNTDTDPEISKTDDSIMNSDTDNKEIIPDVSETEDNRDVNDADMIDVTDNNEESVSPDTDDTCVVLDDGDCIEEDTETPETDENLNIRSMNIVFGKKDNDEDFIWCPNDTEQVLNVNTGIIGTMGTGKTQFTKSLVTQLQRETGSNYNGSPLNILIFDYKGDYNESKPDFLNAVNATVLKPYMLPFNPLSIYKRKQKMPVLPAHTANAFVDTVVKMCKLGPKQRETLLSCILETYKKYGIDKDDESTWDRVAPTFEQVYEIFIREYDSKDSLSSIMNKIHNFCIFEKDPLKAKAFAKVLKGVVVIDISGYEKDMQDLIVAITLDQFYMQMYAIGSSKTNGRYRQLTNMILVDEADSIMSKNFVTLKNILKEGREFGVGVILSTQFLSHFGTGSEAYSNYISTWVVHNVSDLSEREVESIMGTDTKIENKGELYTRIRSLVKHQSIVKVMNMQPVQIEDYAFWQLLSNICE